MCLNIFTLDTFLILVERVNLKSGPCLDSIIPFRSDFIWEDFSEWGGGGWEHWYYKNLKYQWLKGKEDIEVGRWSEFYIFIAFKIRIVSNLIKELKHLYCILIF